jgi:acyl dehydratase
LGSYFEDLEVGQVLTSPGRTLGEHDIAAFAGLSGDYNPLHTDARFAEATPFGGRIAHGLLGLAIAGGLAARLNIIDGTAQAFTGLEWRFRRPVRAGDTIYVEIAVGAKKAMPSSGGGLVTFQVKLLNQAGEVVQRGSWDILLRGRPASEGGDGA